MRYSKQREYILTVVKENPLHLTAEKIYELIKKDVPNISLGTVYRNLAQLVEKELILKISIPGQPDRYDGNLKPHIHFLCNKCNKVYDVFNDRIDIVENMVKENLDVYIESFEISFKGICQKCRQY